MSHDVLRVIWYLLIGVLVTGYAVLAGFDLGVGVLHTTIAKTDEERRKLLNAVGPFWDGNGVWLLTFGGALFAAFPHVYATVFSGFYLALMLLLFALIFRAVSFEFRSQVEGEKWRGAWDWAFCIGSFLPALLTGVALGNTLRGVPLDANMEFTGSFFTLLNPFSLLVGLTGLAMFVMQGAVFLLLKTDGVLAERAGAWANRGWLATVVLAVLTTIVGAVTVDAAFGNYMGSPMLWVVPVLAVVFMAATRFSLDRGAALRAFVFSSLSIAGLIGIVGAANFPYLLRAREVAEHGLTIYNSSSSQNTLFAMFVIAVIGMPIVIVYTAYIYKVFGGKVVVEKGGY